VVSQCSLNAWLSSWFAEISADLWETVARFFEALRDDALYKSTYFTLSLKSCHNSSIFSLNSHCSKLCSHTTLNFSLAVIGDTHAKLQSLHDIVAYYCNERIKSPTTEVTRSVAAGFGRRGMPPPASNDTGTALGQDGSD